MEFQQGEMGLGDEQVLIVAVIADERDAMARPLQVVRDRGNLIA